MSKSKSNSNKPLVIIQTSFSVSFICASALGIIFSLVQGSSFNQFLYMTYIFFVNNLLMPISIAAILFYYIERDSRLGTGITGRLKTIAFLSLASLLLLLIWNMLDFLFHYNPHNSLTLEKAIDTLTDAAIVGIFLALPISVLLTTIYRYIDRKA